MLPFFLIYIIAQFCAFRKKLNQTSPKQLGSMFGPLDFSLQRKISSSATSAFLWKMAVDEDEQNKTSKVIRGQKVNDH